MKVEFRPRFGLVKSINTYLRLKNRDVLGGIFSLIYD